MQHCVAPSVPSSAVPQLDFAWTVAQRRHGACGNKKASWHVHMCSTSQRYATANLWCVHMLYIVCISICTHSLYVIFIQTSDTFYINIYIYVWEVAARVTRQLFHAVPCVRRSALFGSPGGCTSRSLSTLLSNFFVVFGMFYLFCMPLYSTSVISEKLLFHWENALP